MYLQTIFANEVGKIQVDPDLSYLELTWFTHPVSAAFRKLIQQAFSYAQQHELTKWLCNMQQADFLELEDQHWLVKEVFTHFDSRFHHDFAYFIRLLVLEVLTTYHIQHLVETDEKLKGKLTVAIFTDIDQAKQWLFTPLN